MPWSFFSNSRCGTSLLMCDILNNLPITHESLSHHINAQTPLWAEAFTKVPSHHQKLINAIESRYSTRVPTRSTPTCHFTKLVHGVHHATPFCYLTERTIGSDTTCWGDPRREPTSTEVHGNKPKWGFILKPISNRRSSSLDLYIMTLFFKLPMSLAKPKDPLQLSYQAPLARHVVPSTTV